MNITMTLEQYNAIKRLADFAQWYIDEHEGGSGMEEAIEQWESDRDEVERGIQAIKTIEGK
jgi:hypothetical protein